MTKFEELMETISSKKNKDKRSFSDKEENQEDELEVAGSESSKTPLLFCGDEEIDGSIVDDLCRKARHKPLEGQFAESWD